MARLLTKLLTMEVGKDLHVLTELGQCRQFVGRVSRARQVPQPLLSTQNIGSCVPIPRHACVCTCSGKLQLSHRLLKSASLGRCTSNLKMQWVALLHLGDRLRGTVTPQGDTRVSPQDVLRRNHSDGIVTSIKDDEDLSRFLSHVTKLLSSPDFSKVKIPKEDAEVRLEELVQRLLAMKADPRNIYAFLNSNPRILNTRWEVLMQSLQYLDELRLFGNRALLVLDRNPKVWSAKLEQLRERVRRLRKLGLTEGSLQRVLTTSPGVLTLRKNRLNGAVEMLRKCQFSGRQITEVIISSPQVLESDPADIELQFQYVYFTMGLQSQADMVQANLFRYPLEHVRRRHQLLERLGRYEMSNKQGKTRVDNPKLCRIVDCTDARFAEKVAGISPEEFQMFWRSLEEDARRDEEDEREDEAEEDFWDYDDSRQR